MIEISDGETSQKLEREDLFSISFVNSAAKSFSLNGLGSVTGVNAGAIDIMTSSSNSSVAYFSAIDLGFLAGAGADAMGGNEGTVNGVLKYVGLGTSAAGVGTDNGTGK
mmetsp:Transcript_45031/g.67847  ORF Transcript_45031/g.67847 Transcript_45031/m.67847 type:complete len:109 (+) Transcript_45031:643-969(+)